MEALAEIFQQFNDLQKACQEHQKQQWEKLTNYGDCTGNKLALQAKLAKVIEIQDDLSEGELKLSVLQKYLTKSARILPVRSQELMERDLTNLRYVLVFLISIYSSDIGVHE